MKYMKLNTSDRKELLSELEGMPQYLADNFTILSDDETRKRSSDDSFSPIEHVWHLADLEQEGFAFRLQQLLDESNPVLPDFEGGKIANERNYRKLSLEDGLRAFTKSRKNNLKAIKDITEGQWFNKGLLEGVGEITLCDMPSMLSQHDSEHRKEIDVWMKENA